MLENAGCVAVEGIEETGDGVEKGAGAWVERHVVEGAEGEDDANIAWKRY